MLHLLDQGGEIIRSEATSLEGRECLLVEVPGSITVLKDSVTTRFYFDPAMGFAIRRGEELTSSGELVVRSDMSDFVELSASNVWLPKQCKATYYTWYTVPDVITAEPLTYEHFTVKELDQERIPMERFSLNYTVPGTIVSDATLPQAKDQPEGYVRYSIPADPEDLDAAIRSAVDGRPFTAGTISGEVEPNMVAYWYQRPGRCGSCGKFLLQAFPYAKLTTERPF